LSEHINIPHNLEMLSQQVEPPQGGRGCEIDAALLAPAQSPYLAD